MTFKEWKLAATKRVKQLTGKNPDDFEDWGWNDAYESGFSPNEAAGFFAAEMAVEHLIDEF